MGNSHYKPFIENMPKGYCGTACSASKGDAPPQAPPQPPTVYFNPAQRHQKNADVYDSSLQQSRFQSIAPRHF